MNLKNAIRILWFLIISIGLTYCKKNTRPLTKIELLTSSTWKLKSATVGGIDAIHLIQDCQKDNEIKFSSNGSGIILEGISKCNPGDPDILPFIWTFKNNETVLNLSVELYRYGSNDLELVKITSTTMVLKLNYTPPVGPSRIVDLTFEH